MLGIAELAASHFLRAVPRMMTFFTAVATFLLLTPAAAATVPPPTPAASVLDSKGLRLCYDFAHGRCPDPCPKGRSHEPATPAQTEKRIRDEKRMAEKAAKGLKATQSGVSSGGESAKAPKPRGKGKAKGKPKP